MFGGPCGVRTGTRKTDIERQGLQPEKYVPKGPTGAWDKFSDKKNLDLAVYNKAAHELLFPV